MVVATLRPINLTVLGYVEHSEPSHIWKHALGDYDESFRCDTILDHPTITLTQKYDQLPDIPRQEVQLQDSHIQLLQGQSGIGTEHQRIKFPSVVHGGGPARF